MTNYLLYLVKNSFTWNILYVKKKWDKNKIDFTEQNSIFRKLLYYWKIVEKTHLEDVFENRVLHNSGPGGGGGSDSKTSTQQSSLRCRGSATSNATALQHPWVLSIASRYRYRQFYRSSSYLRAILINLRFPRACRVARERESRGHTVLDDLLYIHIDTISSIFFSREELLKQCFFIQILPWLLIKLLNNLRKNSNFPSRSIDFSSLIFTFSNRKNYLLL